MSGPQIAVAAAHLVVAVGFGYLTDYDQLSTGGQQLRVGVSAAIIVSCQPGRRSHLAHGVFRNGQLALLRARAL